MEAESQVTAIAHVIQLSVAPVFLLASISGLLGVLTSRLGRVIDRARMIETAMDQLPPHQQAQRQTRLQTFSLRARLINYAITLATACASMICLVVVALFSGAFFDFDLSRLIGLLFAGAMISLFSALVCFLREIRIATKSLRIGATTEELAPILKQPPAPPPARQE